MPNVIAMLDEVSVMKAMLALFAKYPEPGRVKTRLQPMLGERGASDFARYLLLSSVVKAVDWCLHLTHLNGEPLQLDVAVWTDGGNRDLWQPYTHGGEVPLFQQPQGHLGARMLHAVETHLHTHDAVVLLGPDAVGFQGQHLLALLHHLNQGQPMAFAPAMDGGYVAVACSTVIPVAFDVTIEWGTANVMEQTLRHLAQQGIEPPCLPRQLDIDEPDDLRHAMSLGLVPTQWHELL
ncbi:TIGR04282 family arsenosugar biosynthesis glycosyltransferase [Limnobacter humi]|uniref:TIGR04282 family arsenosugar biosynthesis glycosyltransferase n=1 Tax=Limnobacter humi TaxID=1778671 RepID=A0ABT1WH75_9BURK|nr:TIGR04282 family arsenosugar biosynthesis glycosyltransferase [Limnobacter humi]MCQ8896863.1 TIGR04282 family arsenosugar biosynthesis glycosyltransferase [Limnobacter humi]